jgi:hypothetical protein
VLDNCTGEKLGISVVSGSDGTFELTGLPGTADDPVPVGILAVGVLDDQGAAVRIDTYTFNVKSNEQDRDIYSIPETMATLIPDQLGVTQADDKGSVTGAVYYIASDGNPYPLDCVVGRVEDDPTAEVYYSETSLFDKALTETSANGRFVALNIEPGYVTISALIDGEVVGSVSLPVVASGDSTGGAGTSNISRIILMPADGADPTPDCGQ